MPAKSKGIGERTFDLFFDRCANCIVQITFFITFPGSNGLMDKSILNRFYSNDTLNRTCALA